MSIRTKNGKTIGFHGGIVSVTLIEDSYWIVETLVPYSRRCLILEINKKDGQIIRMFDEKTNITNK